MKKSWVTPQLIVFCKGKPEEAVLCVCKTQGHKGGSHYSNHSCQADTIWLTYHFHCHQACASIAVS